MRITPLVSLAVVLLVAAPAFAGPVNPVFNGDFEVAAPLGAAALRDTPLDGEGLGIGHQALGCTHTANLVFSSDCHGAPTDAASDAGAIASDPGSELAAWTAPGAQEGDLAVVAPAKQNLWYAANWQQFPERSIAFGDADGDGDREATILAGNQMLYQTFAVTSTHSAIPAGLVRAVTLSLEKGAPAGSLSLVLDSFPVESQADWPQAFYNYQLTVPASAWSVAGDVVTIDPLAGSLSGPAAGGWLVEDADEHPTAQQWAAADAQERRALLMQFRVIQFTFWGLASGTQVDDVAFDVRA